MEQKKTFTWDNLKRNPQFWFGLFILSMALSFVLEHAHIINIYPD